jgi:hypothetical protein
VAGAVGVPAAHLCAGAMLTAVGLAAFGYGRAHPQAMDISRPQSAASSPARPEGSGRATQGA